MTKKLIIGNWKMNPASLREAEVILRKISKGLPALRQSEVVICAPYLYLEKLKKVSRKIALGAQDAFWLDRGAYTGYVSPEMLSGVGVKYVILGHSERRALGETDDEVNKKIKTSLHAGLIPILCVGERDRGGDHKYFGLVKTQLEQSLDKVSRNSISKVIIAYEPVWALSSTKDRRDATSADFLEMAIFIRKVLSDKFGSEALKTRIIYGGSANERDAEDFLTHGGVDGLLPGRASLYPEKFIEMVRIMERIRCN